MSALPHGLRYICLFDGKGGLSGFDPSELEQWTPEKGVIWLHFDLEDPAADTWLRNRDDLEQVAVDSLLTVESRPRLTRIGDGALAAFRGVNLNEGATPDDMIGVRIWIDGTKIISTFRRHLFSVEDIHNNLVSGDGPENPGAFLAALSEKLVSRLSETVDNLEDVIGELEAQLLETTSRETRFALANVRRQTIALRRYMAPQREALASLLASKISWLGDRDRLEIRETSDRLIRNLEDLDAIRERAAVNQEELQSRLAEQQNVRMYVLSIVAAIFLPLGFLTGLLGINVGGIPGAENQNSFIVFVVILLVIVTLQIIYFRTRKWF
ncbi:MAG: zinc transporter ZntB [Verrucomicrobiales bacterium]|nr:zinc transporter ZntB [Verrucomicrobiales bacterium]